jgi:hypothetical protein
MEMVVTPLFLGTAIDPLLTAIDPLLTAIDRAASTISIS